MMQSNFKIAFDVEILHTYFQNSICDCLQLVPGYSSLGFINKYGFRINEKTNGLDVYFNSENSISTVFDYITAVTGINYFEFELVSTDPTFNNFTDLPIDWLGQLIYDSQSGSNSYQNGVLVLGENLVSLPCAKNIGSLKIYFADVLRYQNENGVSNFQIQLRARSTQWQYYVINQSALLLENPSIVGKPATGFTGPENVKIQSGQSALFFSSDTLLPLSEVPKIQFDLVNNPASSDSNSKRNNSKIIFKGLPNPDTKHLGVTTTLNGQNLISSPMYVFI
ncbi:MAG TPA: hypothetical protein VFJ43_10550 [Bacteroidia bacterium]|nr:hypothetical protein [Bacteroidia bacterium]